jgi:hypothetical protein
MRCDDVAAGQTFSDEADELADPHATFSGAAT